MIKNFIFDIDGTLIDSNDLHTHAWVEAFAAHGRKVSFKKVRDCMGKGADQLMPEFLDKKEIKKIGKELGELSGKIFQRDYLRRVRPFPKVRMLFKNIRARGGRIALASSADADEVKQYEKIARIEDLVEKSTSADDARKSKPAPDIFHSALKLLGNPRHDSVLVIGDSPHDALAAKRAKLSIAGVLCGGFSKRVLLASGCCAVYKDPADLLKNLDDLFAPVVVKR